MMVMMMAITPSLKAASRSLPIAPSFCQPHPPSPTADKTRRVFQPAPAGNSTKSVGESRSRRGRRRDLADGGAGERQGHSRADQRQDAGEDESGVEIAGGLDE